MCELLTYLKRTGNAQQPDEAVAAAITQWLETMQTYPQEPAPGTPLRGYQWKSLFLPDGTRLRMQYQGDHEYAMVEGDRLIYQGRPVSPNRFANSFGGGVRNVWQELAIRGPAGAPQIPLPHGRLGVLKNGVVSRLHTTTVRRAHAIRSQAGMAAQRAGFSGAALQPRA
jgi:hypothetical protein